MTTRIYVACIAAYNAGRLHGAWIDTEGKDSDTLMQDVAAMLKASPVAGAEEWSIHDSEGFDGLIGEGADLERVATHTWMIAEHGAAWLAYADHVGEHYATEAGFVDAYMGEHDTPRAFAEQFAEEIGLLDGAPEMLARYFDFDAYARDLFIDDFFFAGGFVFRRC